MRSQVPGHQLPVQTPFRTAQPGAAAARHPRGNTRGETPAEGATPAHGPSRTRSSAQEGATRCGPATAKGSRAGTERPPCRAVPGHAQPQGRGAEGPRRAGGAPTAAGGAGQGPQPSRRQHRTAPPLRGLCRSGTRRLPAPSPHPRNASLNFPPRPSPMPQERGQSRSVPAAFDPPPGLRAVQPGSASGSRAGSSRPSSAP